MARGRMLQNRISKSHKMAALSNDTVRLLYTWLLSHLDVNGNFYADPVMVNNLVFTRLGHPVNKIAAALDELSEIGLIVRYSVNGETYLNYPDFQEKQPKLNPAKEGEPDIPILTQELLSTTASVTPAQDKIREVKRREVKCSKHVNDGFEIFWVAYPKKVNKREAQTIWNKTALPPIQTILDAIEKQKLSEQWQTPKYIPYPSSWLNKERWTDELQNIKNEIPISQESPFTVCPKCKREILWDDIEGDGCIKCAIVNKEAIKEMLKKVTNQGGGGVCF